MLGETIQSLRKQNGMTQEQLAERAGVSRQAVSKWETNAAVPELDKLQALCAIFGVTLGELVGEQKAASGAVEAQQVQAKRADAGLMICLIGLGALLGVGLIGLFSPAAAERMGASSVITINGTGIALAACAGVAVIGLVMHLRRKDK